MKLRARVVDGRFVIDDPSPYPDGTELELVVADEGDDLDDEERAALHSALDRSWKSAQQGRLRPASELMDRLRAKD